jgi:hypothetical protein
MPLNFKKNLPGADIVFQPDDINEYNDDAWDIRISIGDAPLEEAFYFTVEDSQAVRKPIEQLLESYALNLELSSQLDVEEYPDLPFMQEELVQYRTNERQGLLKIEYYINHCPFEGPVSLSSPADKYLNVCTYHDRSHDYRVLDLVIVPFTPELSLFDIQQKQNSYGHIYLLMLLEYYMGKGDRGFRKFLKEPPMAAFLGIVPDVSYNTFTNGLRRLEMDHFIKTTGGGLGGDLTRKTVGIELTEKGINELASLKEESRQIASDYDKYDSVSICPVALGIPDGFDVRVQMMEFDGLNFERSVLISVIDESKDDVFGQNDWSQIYKEFSFFDIVCEALAYKTNFSSEILSALKGLANYDV